MISVQHEKLVFWISWLDSFFTLFHTRICVIVVNQRTMMARLEGKSYKIEHQRKKKLHNFYWSMIENIFRLYTYKLIYINISKCGNYAYTLYMHAFNNNNHHKTIHGCECLIIRWGSSSSFLWFRWMFGIFAIAGMAIIVAARSRTRPRRPFRFRLGLFAMFAVFPFALGWPWSWPKKWKNRRR